MSRERSRHSAQVRPRWRRWNRGDLAILLCGVLAFLSITFGGPLLQLTQPAAVGTSAPTAADVQSLEPAPIAVTDPPEGTVAAPVAPATPAEGTTAVPPVQEPALPAAAAPVRIRYPSAGFDVPVHPLQPDSAAQASQTIVPPETKDGYWLTPFGMPGAGSANTTYVIGHSWDGAEAPFNHLSSAAAVGHRFDVDTTAGTMTYQVENVTTYLKSSLKDSPVWDIVPNRLVLISCYTKDPWGKNMVVTASPAVS
ncbi:class F sortase [Arthrobacter sp. Cr_A7]|uniref:class F sortase n=1 Tax=Arthrobacter sp. Cr_A7 TaxID=3031017 RepID=UPI0023DA51F4|nr:class F sortase [Arthrobacter sp. Cr_A7]MDF2048728.1 class F sortase [Arthrobacter sp. Cr_A7]